MGKSVILAEDLVTVKLDGQQEPLVLGWGDRVTLLGPTADGKGTRVQLGDGAGALTGTVRGKPKTQPKGVLQFSLVDVQQGDGMVLETPQGRVLFIDGGDTVLFARYVAARFRRPTAAAALPLDALIVTHGDADHYAGLHEIVKSEKSKAAGGRLFLAPRRVFHNGLVKGPGKDPRKMFGAAVDTPSGCYVVDLVDDITAVDDGRMNRYFKTWKRDLVHWNQQHTMECRRLAAGHAAAFGFLAGESIQVEVLGPIAEQVPAAGKTVWGLPLLHEPPKEPGQPRGKGWSASHTINGHSIVLRIRYGNVRLLLGGDLNQEAMERLSQRVPGDGLEAEIVKVPHHGSADFDLKTLKRMNPVVWLISSGDESSRKEYIHPRANLMGALGGASRIAAPLVFCTELSAFFAYRGRCRSVGAEGGQPFFGFERTSHGIVHVRTDGERVLVFTHSGKQGLKEAYRFRVNARHQVKFEKVEKR